MRTEQHSASAPSKDLIGYRKSCDPDGIGLSHYILLKPEEQKKVQGARA